MSILRLAYKSSLESAKRGARASESSTCFPCWKSNQVTSFWRELFRVRSCQRIFGNADNCIGKLSQCVSKRWECFRTKPKYVENHLKIGPTHLHNIFQTLTTHLNSERTSHFLYQPREIYALFMRRFCLHFDDCRNYVDSLREDC